MSLKAFIGNIIENYKNFKERTITEKPNQVLVTQTSSNQCFSDQITPANHLSNQATKNRCFICNGQNHYAKDCHFGGKLRCFNCELVDHIGKDCCREPSTEWKRICLSVQRVSLIYNHSLQSFVSPRCSSVPQHFSMPTCFCVTHSCCSSGSKGPISSKPLGRNVNGCMYKAHTVANRQAAFHAAEENTEAVLAAQIEEITTHLSASVLADNVLGPSLVSGGSLWSRNSSEDPPI